MNQIALYLIHFFAKFLACFSERNLAVMPLQKKETAELKFNFYRISRSANLTLSAAFSDNSLKI
ncbi:hypothetical protein HDF24_14335 [Mucilaginibacter sp. X4EP1]|uniref:hypothetical protein n=1 Tax=Mucilaginibacter sp. X4EP1 TaxID=2723092 RepID=UPI0021685AA5|nr:hypothetical protein [Mucilaginibacter sp. X4EP1]MCS3814745.1 hypothetical protein [Mucilaginibacter sp. X4EP1]